MPNTAISSAAVNSDLSDIAAQLTNSLAADGQTTMTGQIKAQTGSAGAPGYSFAADLNSGFYSAAADVIGVAVGGVAVGEITSIGFSNLNGVGVGVPVGTVVDYAGSSAPTGWLLCYGQSLATATYPDLFTAIGYTYGGSGPNFSMPDCRGRATYGKDNMGGSTAGRISVSGANFDATVLGATGGLQSRNLLQTQLPNVDFVVTIGSGQGSHSHSIANAAQAGSNANGGSGGNASNGVTITTTGSQTLPALSGTAASGGLGGQVPMINPAIIFNKIIFAGV